MRCSKPSSRCRVRRRRDPDAVAEAVRARRSRGAVAQRWGKKPMCHVHVLDGMDGVCNECEERQ